MSYFVGVRLAGGFVGFDPNQELCTGDLDNPNPDDVGDPIQRISENCNCETGSLCFTPQRINSYDPNLKIGPPRYQNNTMEWAYTIYFENADSATASAQTVRIVDSLDITRYDLSSFAFLGYGFGDVQKIFSATTQTSFDEVIDLETNDSISVRVKGNLIPGTGVVEWQLSALDSITLQPIDDVFAGFLPPNDST
jgi:hypothetical protein